MSRTLPIVQDDVSGAVAETCNCRTCTHWSGMESHVMHEMPAPCHRPGVRPSMLMRYADESCAHYVDAAVKS